MSWSEPFTGARSIFLDSYHRIALKILFDDTTPPLESEEWNVFSFGVMNIVKSGILHIYFDCTIIPSIQAIMGHIHDILEKVFSCYKRSDLIFTLALPVESVLSDIDFAKSHDFIPNLLFIKYGLDRDGVVSIINQLENIRLEFPVLHFGIAQVPNSVIMEYIFARIPVNFFVAYQIGPIHPPNFESCQIKYYHGRGLNTFVELNASTLNDHNSPMHSLALEYKKPMSTVLCKVVLQLGSICSILCDVASLSQIQSDIACLAHPFTYRKTYVSPTTIIHFEITPEHMDRIEEASEAVEEKADEAWLPLATQTPAHIPLSF